MASVEIHCIMISVYCGTFSQESTSLHRTCTEEEDIITGDTDEQE
jgi:hypothetical protein